MSMKTYSNCNTNNFENKSCGVTQQQQPLPIVQLSTRKDLAVTYKELPQNQNNNNKLSVTTTIMSASVQQQQPPQPQQPQPPPQNPPIQSENVEKRCDNADCNAAKLVSLVPKRKTSQFVTQPVIMEKPMLVNGFTTVFQVDGESAKLADLQQNTTGGKPKTIYRIVPNTHAHIVNYVVVDAEGESLRKINEGDPNTMRKLLNSQKNSAEQMLKKLIAAGATNPIPVATTVSNSATTNHANRNSTILNPSVGESTPTIPSLSTITSPMMPLTPIQQLPPVSVAAAAAPPPPPPPVIPQNTLHPLPTMPPINFIPATPSSSMGTISSPSPVNVPAPPTGSTTQIQLPLRMHPNLKITAVASADQLSSLNTMSIPVSQPQVQPTSSQQPPLAPVPQMPLITPVPLANLQNASSLNMSGNNSNMMGSPLSMAIQQQNQQPPPLSQPLSQQQYRHYAPSLPLPPLAQVSAPIPSVPNAAPLTVEKPAIHKMQAEIEELRRTVAFLAEAQKKTTEATAKRKAPAKKSRYSGANN